MQKVSKRTVKKEGYDGLFDPDKGSDCSCRLVDCDSDHAFYCTPGYIQDCLKCDNWIIKKGNNHCAEGYDYCINDKEPKKELYKVGEDEQKIYVR